MHSAANARTMEAVADIDIGHEGASQKHGISWVAFASPLLANALCWGILFLLFPPAQENFPLGDDWAYGHSALLLAQGKGIHYVPYFSGMPQLGQWLWAWPFLQTPGPTFFLLRLSTVVLGWLAIAAFIDLLRAQGLSGRQLAFIGGALALSPLFFVLQGSYMTDVPALSFALLSLALYSRAVTDQRPGLLLAGCAVAILGVIIRQTALVVALVALYLVRRRQSLAWRPLWYLAAVLPLAAGIGAHVWLQNRPDVVSSTLNPVFDGVGDLVLRLFWTVHWCGLLALPVLLIWPRPRSWACVMLAMLVLGAIAVRQYWVYTAAKLPVGFLFPYGGGIITPCGVFIGMVRGQLPEVMGTATRVGCTVGGVLGGALLIDRLVAWHWRQSGADAVILFTVLELPLVMIAPTIYDRYVLSLLPGVLYIAGCPPVLQPRRRLRGGLLIAASALCSLALVHDCFAWNRARWKLGREAVERSALPWEIEGGFEWDGWYSQEAPQRVEELPQDSLAMGYTRMRFPDITGHMALSFSPLPGTKVLATEPYRLWLSPGNREFYLVESAR